MFGDRCLESKELLSEEVRRSIESLLFIVVRILFTGVIVV